MMKVVGFAGFSGSGKTSLVERLIPVFRLKGLVQMPAKVQAIKDFIATHCE